MTDVWVLSEESPFDDEETSGGCVSGVFATPAAALYYLGTVELGPDILAAITWDTYGSHRYEGRGWGTAIYILQRHEVQDEATLRADYQTMVATYGCKDDAGNALTTEALCVLLPPRPPPEERGS